MFHLQTVFERAKEIISIGQLAALLLADKTPVSESAQTYESVRYAQPLVEAAKGQLESLRDEFDLSYSTPAQFHVKAALLFNLVIDLLLCQTDTGKGIRYGNMRSKNVGGYGVRETREECCGARR